MAFHDVRLSPSISRQFASTRAFNTTVVGMLSGHEQRNANWANHKPSYNCAYPLSLSMASELQSFFLARQGRLSSFRFKDWLDYTIGDDATDTYQSIGTGDGAEVDFQIYKRYTSGATTYDINKVKIIESTLRVWVNAVEAVSGWTVDALTGIITFSVAPTNTHDVAVLCEFDEAVRFDTDSLTIVMSTSEWSEVPNVPLVGVIDE